MSRRRGVVDAYGWAACVAHRFLQVYGGVIVAEIDSGIELDDWQKEWAENAKNPAPLHPELEGHLYRADPSSRLGWDTLKHPLRQI